MKKNILVVDDEMGPRESLKAILSGLYDVTTAENGERALAELSKRRADLVMMDVIMPDRDGLHYLRHIRSVYPGMPVVMVSASSAVQPVVEAMRSGASDYVSKPFDVQEILRIVERTLESNRMQRRLETLEGEVAREFPVRSIVGSSPAFLSAMEDLRKAADSDATVLITGGSGTGKELAARLLHESGPRRSEPFVAVHCAALPETLMESELFGHERGAFTSADRQKQGRFDLAGSGTLFFDEVSEMSLATQVKLLRVLQEREFMRVGGTRVIRTDARIVAATSRDLKTEAAAGRFRDDLFYRLSVVPIALPALRERGDDIPLLAQHFLDGFARSADARLRAFEPEAMECMRRYPWPGNIRELRNIIERMIVLHRQDPSVRAEFLPAEFHPGGRAAPAPAAETGTPANAASGAADLESAVNEFERELIERALRETRGVQTRAAERLGTTRRILRYRIEKLGIGAPPDGADSDGN